MKFVDREPGLRQGEKMQRSFRITVGIFALVGAVTVLLGVTPIPLVLSRQWSLAGDIQSADAIVVLGGGAGSDGLYLHSSARMLKGLELYHKGLAPLIVFTGGSTDGRDDSPVSEGAAFLRVWQELGMPVTAARVDTRAANTHENAVETRRLLGSTKRILLVTSNLHMRRAAASFAREGFTVLPAPVPPRPERLPHPASRWTAAAALLYEWTAFLDYRLRGWL